jgi:hypothetical protein
VQHGGFLLLHCIREREVSIEEEATVRFIALQFSRDQRVRNVRISLIRLDRCNRIMTVIVVFVVMVMSKLKQGMPMWNPGPTGAGYRRHQQSKENQQWYEPTTGQSSSISQ